MASSLRGVLASSSSPLVCKYGALRRNPAAKQPGRLVRCSTAGGEFESTSTARRSANYQPNSWTHDCIQSLTHHSLQTGGWEEENITRRDVLKEDVRKILKDSKEVKDQLQLVDHLQQLGVAYHFKHDIKHALGTIYASLEDVSFLLKSSLHATALLFRLLRENGFDVSRDVLIGRFRDERRGFKSCIDEHRKEQTTGLLSLYEASYLAKEGEVELSEAADCIREHLKGLSADAEPHLREQVAHALELPMNWRMQRAHARWFIEACQRKPSVVDPRLLEFAKLDFNMVQNIHRRELVDTSRWWANLGLAKKLPFFRDRLMQNYLWTVGWAFEPEHGSFREMQTRANCFVALIDDVYDVYGVLSELEIFTDAVDRWDIRAINSLPEYMKICFIALFNATNDAAYRVMRDKGLDILPLLRRAWSDLCRTFLVEAKWYHEGHTPKLQEYLDNGWITASGHVALTHAFCTSKHLTEEALRSLSGYPEIAKPSCMLFRLYNDLATSSAEIARGDSPESVQCCMREQRISEGMARGRVGELIEGNWRALNGDRAAASPLEEELKSAAVNIARTAQFVYQRGDGYGAADGEIKDRILSLLIHPIN